MDACVWLEEWVEENVTHAEEYQSRQEAERDADRCRRDAEIEDVDPAELDEASDGDLPAFLIASQLHLEEGHSGD